MIYIVSIITFLAGCLIGFLITKLNIKNSDIEIAKLKEQLKAKDSLINTSKNLEELVKEQFTNLANKTILEKQNDLQEQNSKLLQPLFQNIDNFRKRIEDFSKEGQVNTQTIKEKIETLTKENNTIRTSADELTKALKENSQQRGAFGEIILENILKISGLKDKTEFGEAGNYTTQKGYKDLNNLSANALKPDAVIFLPDNKNIIVDSKLALNDFKEFANSNDDAAKTQYLNAFYKEVETMIADLSQKYNNLENLHTPDFKLMFIPLESCYSYIYSNQKLIEEAAKNNIIIVGPASLLAALRIINYCWVQKNQANNIEQILKLGKSMCEKCKLLEERLKNFKAKIDKLQDDIQGLETPLSGRGGLTGIAKKFTELGLNTTKDIEENE